MDLSKLTQGEKIVLGAGALLIIDLLFLAWHKVGNFSLQAIEDPNGFYGVMALLVTIVMVGLLIAKVANAKLPNLPAPLSQILMIAGILVFVLLFLKLIVETTALGIGAYLGILLGAALAFGGYSISKEAGATGGFGGLGRRR